MMVVIVLMIMVIRDIAYGASTSLGDYKSILTAPVTHFDQWLPVVSA
jgi:hypothetical protein